MRTELLTHRDARAVRARKSAQAHLVLQHYVEERVQIQLVPAHNRRPARARRREGSGRHAGAGVRSTVRTRCSARARTRPVDRHIVLLVEDAQLVKELLARLVLRLLLLPTASG
jgi:hypothetical protein